MTVEKQRRTIAAVGDVNPCRDLAGWLQQQDLVQKQLELARFFTGSQLVLGNLEGPVTTGRPPRDGQVWNLHVPQEVGGVLSGFHGFTLANNHIFDYGREGFEDTTAFLDSLNIRYCGAGLTAAEAARACLFDLDGFVVSMIGITDRNWHPGATNSPGTATWNDSATRKLIASLARKTDFVIVQVHQGYEFIEYPGPEECAVADWAVSAGADLVLGHHSHYVMGVQRKGTAAIAYGLGDFLLDKKHIPRPYREQARKCAVFFFTIARHRVVDWSIRPCLTNEYGWPESATPDVEASILERFEELSRLLERPEKSLRYFRNQAGRNMLPYALRLLVQVFRSQGLRAALERISRIRLVDLGVLGSRALNVLRSGRKG